MAFETILTDEQKTRYAGYWRDRVITDFLDEAAAATPDKVAFVDPRRRVTYGELRREVDRCALGLRELGVGPGDVVSFQLPNWIEWIVLHYAASRIGASASSVSWSGWRGPRSSWCPAPSAGSTTPA
jgi:cyclohexanecarboxylate-CoA ligase